MCVTAKWEQTVSAGYGKAVAVAKEAPTNTEKYEKAQWKTHRKYKLPQHTHTHMQ